MASLSFITIMPLNLTPNPTYMQQMLDDDSAKEKGQKFMAQGQPAPSTAPTPSPMSPDLAQIIGGLSDAASTYTFLKRGASTEADPVMKHLGNRPLATGLGVAGEALGQALIARLLKNKFPKVAPVVNALEGNLGATSFGVGALNHELTTSNKAHDSAANEYLSRIRKMPDY